MKWRWLWTILVVLKWKWALGVGVDLEFSAPPKGPAWTATNQTDLQCAQYSFGFQKFSLQLKGYSPIGLNTCVERAGSHTRVMRFIWQRFIFLFELDGYAFWRQWSCKCFLSEGNSGQGDLIMMNFVTPGGGSVGKLHWVFCTASSISHRPISCKMKCTCPPYCIRKAVLASGFPPGEKGSFTSKVSFLHKSLSVYVYLKQTCFLTY